ncbi:cupin domain-containing protein [Methylocapsa palsarum]|uniref:Cupin 2 domain-containing protein n=1 Tax=Methylocapsa palsarum TaxID=1612308 RepID=A0A1I3YQB1_9HYPH|nr:cupin domain-containing protein [Methylocapsa palsarum]SFK34127.1 cupin 2 domain-containing protein [Methylocapsa palsarum]
MPLGNLFEVASLDLTQEIVSVLAGARDVRIERIVSRGQASPPGFWYDQDSAEWVVLLTGSAGLSFENEDNVRVLSPGDHVFIPARQKHRVEWTSESGPTIWLAVHFPDAKETGAP